MAEVKAERGDRGTHSPPLTASHVHVRGEHYPT